MQRRHVQHVLFAPSFFKSISLHQASSCVQSYPVLSCMTYMEVRLDIGMFSSRRSGVVDLVLLQTDCFDGSSLSLVIVHALDY